MRFYEIIIMFDPNENNKILKMIKKYSDYIKNNKGQIYRIENWGKRKLSYKIKNNKKAYYVLLNIEMTKEKIIEFEKKIKFDSFILRKFIIRTKKAITKNSPIFKNKKKNIKK
ncbi:30S ribosomal protein S6 [Enterobacterales bacterium endosymbiont of Anomoneura mori]|uniref:30S ribosomal protein S6 n=1 Tax=Enterobacterales bacterium endosymbiont of Anomoneura mori TaxID=3132096 RepID=UPI00399C4BFE